MEMSDWKKILKIDHNRRIALYYQIVQNITALYQGGTLKAGEMLPSEWDLSDIYQVSRLTVRQALKELESAGMIKRKPGVGTFFSSPTSTNIYQNRLGFTQKIRNLGKTPSSKIISLKRIVGSKEVVGKLQLPENSQVVRIERLRYADSEPIMVETAFLSAENFADITEESLGEGSLYDYLTKQYGILVHSVEQELYPVLLSENYTQLLQSESGSPAMHSEVVAFGKDQKPIEYSVSIINGEKCHFYFRYREEGN